MYLFNFLKKYFLIILISSIIWWAVWYASWNYFWENYVKLKMFLTVSVSDENSSVSEKEEAATFFWETLIWWFQNPSFTAQILKNHEWNSSVTAYKQERQNLIIEIKSWSKNAVQALARDSFWFLNKKIAQLNKKSDSKYSLVDWWYSFQKSFDIKIIYAILFFILFWFFTTVIFVIKDYLKWVLLSENDAKKILWWHLIDYISEDFSKNDYSIISVWIQKLKWLVILWWVWVDIEKFSIWLSQKHSFAWEDMVLIDWDLEKRQLQHDMWLSSRLKNLKWITNLDGQENDVKMLWKPVDWEENSETENPETEKTENKKTEIKKTEMEKTNLYLQNTLDDNLRFIPAWTWSHFAYNVLDQLSEKVRILVHTHLPKNADILRVKTWTLILLIKIWVTKIEDLQKIKEAWNGEVKYIIVK